jgi:hypothetical protein
MIRYACPRCHSVLESPDSLGGAVSSCPHCSQPLRVPPPAALPADEPEPAVAVRPYPGPGLPLVSPRRPSVRPHPPADALPADPGSRSMVAAPPEGPSLAKQLIALGVLLFSGFLASTGGAAVLMAFGQGIDNYQAEQEPEEVQLTDLLNRWPKGNHHVVLTDFVCGTPFYISNGSSSSAIWVPVYPREEVGPDRRALPRAVRAMVYCDREDQEDEVLRQCRQGRVQGLATRGVVLGSLGTKWLLKESPDTDFSACLKVDAGRRPLSRTFLYALASSGAASLLLGIVIGLVCLRVLAPGAVRAVFAVIRSPFCPAGARVGGSRPLPPPGDRGKP